MRIKYKRVYNQKVKGTKVFVYLILGYTPEQLAQYTEDQGDYFKEDEESGEPLFFSTKYYLDNTALIRVNANTKNVRWIGDTSELDKADNLARQYGGNFGQSLADLAAANTLGVRTNSVAPKEQAPRSTTVKDDLVENHGEDLSNEPPKTEPPVEQPKTDDPLNVQLP